MQKFLLSLVLISSSIFLYSQELDLKEFQTILDFYTCPFIVSIQEDILIFTPKIELNQTRKAYDVEMLFQAWSYYSTKNKLSLKELGIKFIEIKTIGKANILDLVNYSKNQKTLLELFN